MLDAYWSAAAPLITRRYRGEVEKFIGDGIVATFNSRGDQPDHATRAAAAALALQRAFARIQREHPEWPQMRIGVNSGDVVVREVGGQGHVAYPVLGDAVNTGSRLEGLAPPGRRLDRVGDLRPAAGRRRRRGAAPPQGERQGRARRRVRPRRLAVGCLRGKKIGSIAVL